MWGLGGSFPLDKASLDCANEARLSLFVILNIIYIFECNA